MNPDYYDVDGYEASTLEEAVSDIVASAIDSGNGLPNIKFIMAYTDGDEEVLSPQKLFVFTCMLQNAYEGALEKAACEREYEREVSSPYLMGRV